ncbi:MAG: DNA primase, partial [Caulobacteraceae bacterium]
WRLHPEPTLCFDGDAAGLAAASRAIDRALPLLKPGRSFAFAILEGGKDPDEVLREKGPAALKDRLSAARPFVDALFIRERDAVSLGTPERRAGLRQRLRAAARAIGDPDLARAYSDALHSRIETLFAPAAFNQVGPGGRRGRDFPASFLPTAEGKAAAKRLARSIEPAAAALAQGVLADPEVLDDHLEEVQRHGFGDPALGPLAGEIVTLRLAAERLDSQALRRHLVARGFSALLIDIEQAAAHAGAPFLREDVTLAAARSQWSYAFVAASRAAALDEALASAKAEMAGGSNASRLMALKAERDALRRAIKTGTLWTSHPAD